MSDHLFEFLNAPESESKFPNILDGDLNTTNPQSRKRKARPEDEATTSRVMKLLYLAKDDGASAPAATIAKEEPIDEQPKESVLSASVQVTEASPSYSRSDRYFHQCAKCRSRLAKAPSTTDKHIWYHLYRDYGVFRFSCPIEGCRFGNYAITHIDKHVCRCHWYQRDIPVIETNKSDVPDLFKQVYDECFGRSVDELTPTDILREKLVKKKEERFLNFVDLERQSVPSEAIPSIMCLLGRALECHICHGSFTNAFPADAVNEHAFTHGAHQLNIDRYRCRLCKLFTTPYEPDMIEHTKAAHSTEHRSAYEDFAKEWDDETLMTISLKCFSDPTLVLKLNDREWQSLDASKNVKQNDVESQNSASIKNSSFGYEDDESIMNSQLFNLHRDRVVKKEAE